MNRVYFLLLLYMGNLFGEGVESAVVKIYLTRNIHNYYSPWNPPSQGSSSATGFVIEGERIMTNAHIVADAVFIQIKYHNGTEAYKADVEWVGHDCDLAILRVDDPTFFSRVTPLTMSDEMAEVQDDVYVYGYPIGGEELSITRGIVSRTEMRTYVHSGANLLCSQIDAPINPGNSGGPILSNGKVVGVVHQGYQSGQNLGYMIPIPIIQHFLKEVEESRYEGFPTAGVHYQTMENPALRKYYQMEGELTGVLITHVSPYSFLSEVLRTGDVLLSVDNIEIANNGSITFGDFKRLSLSYLFSLKFYNDRVDLKILRDGEILDFSVSMEKKQSRSYCISGIEYDKYPSYFIIGGLVFQPLDINYLTYWFDKGSLPLNLAYHAQQNKGEDDCLDPIILSRILPDDTNMGYQSIVDEVITEVNGKQVQNMQELVQAFEQCLDPFFHIVTEKGVEIVLDRDLTLERNKIILENYLIPYDRSIDLR